MVMLSKSTSIYKHTIMCEFNDSAGCFELKENWRKNYSRRTTVEKVPTFPNIQCVNLMIQLDVSMS